ncbi:MAG: hypothetical protein ACREB0_12575 [Sphingopyxis sp.]
MVALAIAVVAFPAIGAAGQNVATFAAADVDLPAHRGSGPPKGGAVARGGVDRAPPVGLPRPGGEGVEPLNGAASRMAIPSSVTSTARSSYTEMLMVTVSATARRTTLLSASRSTVAAWSAASH